MSGDDDRTRIVDRILRSSKYRSLDHGFVERVVAESLRNRSPKAAEQEARSRLHQAYGAFVTGRPVRAVARARAAIDADPSGAPAALRTAMRSHQSTVEREAHLDEFGALVERWCGAVASIVDLAGGLGALMIPWLPLAPGGRFDTIDIDVDVATALDGLGPYVDAEVTAECRDLIADQPRLRADLALLLKAATTLDAQRDGTATAVIRRLDCAHVIASFPCRSLGGRRRYHVALLDLAHAVFDGTGFEITDDERLGDEHYVHATPSPLR